MCKTVIFIGLSIVVLACYQQSWCATSDASLQITNYGVIGPAGEENFFWADQNPHTLFWGTFIIATPDTVWAGFTSIEFSDYSSRFLPDGQLLSGSFQLGPGYITEVQVCSTAFLAIGEVCSLRIQQYTVGLWDGAFCDSVILQQYVITNLGPGTCSLKVAIWLDWDVLDYFNNIGGGSEPHQVIWIEDASTPNYKFGAMRVPSDDINSTLRLLDNPTWDVPFLTDDQLRKWLSQPGLDLSENRWGPYDKSFLLGTRGIVLEPGEKHLEEYFIFGWDTDDVPLDKRVWKTWLRNAGYYRGDINTDNRGHERDINNKDVGPAPLGGQINVTDVVFLAKFVLKETASPWPFTDQGDINFDGAVNLADVIGLANYIFKRTNVPIDRNRFLPADYRSLFSRPSIYENLDWR